MPKAKITAEQTARVDKLLAGLADHKDPIIAEIAQKHVQDVAAKKQPAGPMRKRWRIRTEWKERAERSDVEETHVLYRYFDTEEECRAMEERLVGITKDVAEVLV